MVAKFRSIALAGAVMVVAAPAFAQDISLNSIGIPLNPLSLDLDPFHVFTPAPPPAPMKPMMHKKMMKKKMMKK